MHSPILLLAMSLASASSQHAELADHLPGMARPDVQCGMTAYVGAERPTFVNGHLLDVPRPPSSEKLLRDAYEVTANQMLTDNFALRWGNSGGVTHTKITQLADAFEEAWAIYIDEEDHPLPIGADTYRLNVYIGDSGNGAPDGNGAKGYFWYDSEGWPMIVVAADTLEDPDSADITATHELYHAIQAATERFTYEDDSAWFWEASATWAAATVYPDNIWHASNLFAYAFLPHYPANYFNYADSTDVQDFYQYGAFILPLHLTEVAADRSLVREVWTDTGPEGDPLSVLIRLMDERGLDFNEAFLDHAARMATLDYEQSLMYDALIDGYSEYYTESDYMVAHEVGPEGTAGLVDGPPRLAPRRYGYNAIRIDPGESDTLHIEVEGDRSGSRSNLAEWGGRVVTVKGARRTYAPVVFDRNSGAATVSGLDGETVWLVVSAWTEETEDYAHELFEYQYSVTMGGEANDGTDTDGTDKDSAPAGTDTGEADLDDDGEDTASSELNNDREDPEASSQRADKAGCSSVGLLTGSAWLVGLLAAARRRR